MRLPLHIIVCGIFILKFNDNVIAWELAFIVLISRCFGRSALVINAFHYVFRWGSSEVCLDEEGRIPKFEALSEYNGESKGFLRPIRFPNHVETNEKQTEDEGEGRREQTPDDFVSI